MRGPGSRGRLAARKNNYHMVEVENVIIASKTVNCGVGILETKICSYHCFQMPTDNDRQGSIFLLIIASYGLNTAVKSAVSINCYCYLKMNRVFS